MKRVGNLFEKFISTENVISATKSAMKGKLKRRDIKAFLKDYKPKLITLIQEIKTGFTPSSYTTKIISDKGKRRTLSIAPFYPDRIVHHMINNILEEVFLPTFIDDTYQCIIGRGSHKCIEKTNLYLKEISCTTSAWVLKADISKYYPSVDNEILKAKIRQKIKDERFLSVVDSLIDSHKGLPLGNHTSQLLGNIFLSDLDHTIKGVSKYYIRYADDLVVFGDKATTKKAYMKIVNYCASNNLVLNSSTQYYNIKKRYLDFMGFRFYGTPKPYTRAKKQKLIYYKHLKKDSVYGWLKESKNLIFLCKVFSQNIHPKYFEMYLKQRIKPKDKYSII